MPKKTVNAKALERELCSIFDAPDFSLQNETTKTIRKQVTERLGVEDLPTALKVEFKAILTRLINESKEEEEKSESEQEEEDDDDDEPVDEEEESNESDHFDDDESDEENEKPAKKRKTKTKKSAPKKKQKKAAPAKKKSSSAASLSSSYSANVQCLLDLGNAMRMGPRLYKGLKDMGDEDERIEILTERLQEAGASWKGKFPSKHDVAKAKAAKKKSDDLDGIDTSLIIEGGRGGRRSRGRVNYAVDNVKDDSDEEDDAEKEVQDDNDEDRPKKRPQKKSKETDQPSSDDEGEDNAQPSSGDDDDDSDEDFGGDESSEAEFD